MEICTRLSSGETLRAICRRPGFPAESTVRLWAVNDVGGFYTQYTRARDIGLDSQADQLLEIADRSRTGKRTKKKQNGHVWICDKCEQECRWYGDHWQHIEDRSPLCAGIQKPRKEIKFETEVSTGDMVDRSRLQVDARKWYLSKLAPKRYGEKLILEQSDDRLNELMDLLKSGPAKPKE